jgi:ribosome recycling factor
MSEAERNSIAIWNMLKELEDGRRYKSLLESIKERLEKMHKEQVENVVPRIIEEIDRTLKGKE